jgi:hypothetical protein
MRSRCRRFGDGGVGLSTNLDFNGFADTRRSFLLAALLPVTPRRRTPFTYVDGRPAVKNAVKFESDCKHYRENANPLKAGALVRLTCFCLPERVRNGVFTNLDQITVNQTQKPASTKFPLDTIVRPRERSRSGSLRRRRQRLV